MTDSHLDGSKAFAAAVQLGLTGDYPWRGDGDPVVEVHLLQTPPPEYDRYAATF